MWGRLHLSECISKMFFKYSVSSLSCRISLKCHDFPVKSLDEILQISFRCYKTENSIRNSIMQFFCTLCTFLYIVHTLSIELF